MKRILLTASFALALASAAAAEGLDVQASHPALPANGDPIVFSVRTPRDGSLRLTLYDLQHRQVRELLREANARAGLHTAQWRGETDGQGKAGTGQAYYPVATLSGGGGPDLVWDPAIRSGGQPVDISPMDCRFDRAAGLARFTLSQPARVRLRAGIHHGPLLATLLEWAPRRAGEHAVAWDGRDTTGRIDVAGNKDFSLAAQAYSLPEGSVLVEGEPAESSGLTPKTEERAAQVRKESLVTGAAKDPHAAFAKAVEAPPGFTAEFVGPLTTQGGIPVVGARAAVRVALDAASAGQMLADRFEIVVYVDMVRIFEEEQAYTPYTVEMDTGPFPPGDHMLSVTVASLSDRISTVSVPFKVTR